jgi:GT2 family glycosyltransferase
MSAVIDVIVPVYDGIEQTRRCLESVRQAPQRTAFELVVVDDATPRPEIAADLDALAREGRITLLRNAANEGFVRSANRGMALHPDRDVVLLNSDTEVANDWLDRLAAAAQGANDVGTVTPFSNNATICSYPFEGWAGGLPGTLGLAGLDRVIAEANAKQRAEIPTAVGFCMYVRRACLERVGAFDAERFGRGYGEENDFCLRAAAAGWRHVLAADVFVFHEGAVSFAAGRAERVANATAALLERHPGYSALIQEFIERDPLAARRASIDRARAARGPAEAAAVLRERDAERARILTDHHAANAEREALRRGLSQATAIVEERSARLAARDRDVDARDAEIARLHAGLANAEALAVERLKELEHIRRLPLWRYYRRLVDRRRNG